MADITLVRQDPVQITEADKMIARRVIFGIVDGLGERGRKQWRRLWNNILRLEPGEMVELTTLQPRLGWYHRKHFAMEQALFEAQERFEEFESFRTWLKVGAGHVDWFPGPKGGVIPFPAQSAMQSWSRPPWSSSTPMRWSFCARSTPARRCGST